MGRDILPYIPGVLNYMPWRTRVARGESGFDYINKFGHNADIDTGTIPEDVWSGGGTYTFTADGGAPYFISSSSTGDTMDITLRCLTEDSNTDWNQEDVTVTLQGQAKVPITFPSGDDPVRFYRGFNANSVDIAGDVYIYEDDTLTGGVPDTASKIRGVIMDGDNQTEMCIYTVPSNFRAYFEKGYVGLSSTIRAASMEFIYAVRVHGGVFRTQGRISLDSAGSGFWQYEYMAGFPALPAKTDVKITVVDVTANNMGAVGGFDLLLERISC
jgi:hypothetical protein